MIFLQQAQPMDPGIGLLQAQPMDPGIGLLQAQLMCPGIGSFKSSVDGSRYRFITSSEWMQV